MNPALARGVPRTGIPTGQHCVPVRLDDPSLPDACVRSARSAEGGASSAMLRPRLTGGSSPPVVRVATACPSLLWSADPSPAKLRQAGSPVQLCQVVAAC